MACTAFAGEHASPGETNQSAGTSILPGECNTDGGHASYTFIEQPHRALARGEAICTGSVELGSQYFISAQDAANTLSDQTIDDIAVVTLYGDHTLDSRDIEIWLADDIGRLIRVNALKYGLWEPHTSITLRERKPDDVQPGWYLLSVDSVSARIPVAECRLNVDGMPGERWIPSRGNRSEACGSTLPDHFVSKGWRTTILGEIVEKSAVGAAVEFWGCEWDHRGWWRYMFRFAGVVHDTTTSGITTVEVVSTLTPESLTANWFGQASWNLEEQGGVPPGEIALFALDIALAGLNPIYGLSLGAGELVWMMLDCVEPDLVWGGAEDAEEATCFSELDVCVPPSTTWQMELDFSVGHCTPILTSCTSLSHDDPFWGWHAEGPIVIGETTPPAPAETDLIARDVWMSTQAEDWGKHYVVAAPVTGQSVYLHFEYDWTGEVTCPTHRAELRLDGDVCCYADIADLPGWHTVYICCTTPWTAVIGPHTLTGEADLWDDVDETLEDNNYTDYYFTAAESDTTPPETWLTYGPEGDIAYADVTLTWTGDDDITSHEDLEYLYILEGHNTSWSSWGSDTGQSYSNLPDGAYTFKVTTRDDIGNEDPSPAARSFSVDSSAEVFIVAPDGLGDYPTIQAAINAAADGDTIWLTDGTFTGDGNRDIDYFGKAIVVRSQSDDPEACIINCQGSAENAHRGFYFHNDEGSDSVLRGVAVQNGYVTIGSPFYGDGGGIWCRDGASPSFENCIFRTNVAEDEGGAAYLDEDCVITFADCRFVSNESRGSGGALEIDASLRNDPVTLAGCIFSDNAADSDGGAVSASGPLVVQQSTFLSNYAGHQVGGAIRWSGTWEDNIITVSGCEFIENLAPTGGGGAVFLWGTVEQALISDCYFAGNSAESGGALFSNISTSLGNCVFVDNSSTESYGTVFFSGSATHVVEHCTIAGSKAPDEGSGIRASVCNVTLNNSIMAFGNSPAASCEYDATVTLNCCNVYGNTGGDYVGCIADQLGVSGNISLDPLFWDGAHGDVHLQPDSPCAPAQQPTCGLIGARDVALWADCNENGMDDACDIHCGSPGGHCDLPGCGQSLDCNGNGSPDECDLEWETSPDCNGNGVPDECDIDGGWSDDYDLNGVPDECEDCNSNGVSDNCDVDCSVGDCASDPLGCGGSADCQPNGVPDECDIASGDSQDIDGNGIPDECERCLGHESFKLLASDGTANHEFGTAVALDGDVALVGDSSESAYIFRFNGQDWVEEQSLEPSGGVVNDEYGTALDVHGDWAIVGAPAEDHLGQASGSVYVFHYDGEAWIEHQELLASDGEAGDFFGDAVAMCDDVIVAGAPNDDDDSGATYVFRLDDGTWYQECKIVPSDAEEGDRFGRAVGIDGDRILVGSANDDGAAYVFHYSGGTWEEEAKVTPLDAPVGGFGYAVGISADRAVVGAPFDDEYGTWTGEAYVFRLDETAWEQECKLTSLDASQSETFGYSIALEGWTAIVGAPFRGSSNKLAATYVYQFDGTLWREVAKLKATDEEVGDQLGWCVGLSGSKALLGAPYDDDLGNVSGSAYTFGGLGDCNGNTYLDICDIVNEVSADCQPNGVPDECDIDPTDPDGDAYVSDDTNSNGAPDECEYAAICREPETLENVCYEGEDAITQWFSVWECGYYGVLEYTITDDASWLECTPASETSEGEHDLIEIVYSTASLPAGPHTGIITITAPDATNSPQEVAITLTVNPVPPAICHDPPLLSAQTDEGKDATNQSFDVWNCGDNTLSYTITVEDDWLSVEPIEGSSVGEADIVTHTVRYETAGLAPGAYAAVITISDMEAENSPQTIDVALTVRNVISIQPDGSGEYPTIQAAIDAAVDGDIIELADGTYIGPGNRDIDYVGKAITVRSASDNPNTCMVDCFGVARGFSFESGETASAVLRGIAIKNGDSTYGGGIVCSGTWPIIWNCIIADCTAEEGAGAYCEYAEPTLINCLLVNNAASVTGGGLTSYGWEPVLLNCTLSGNSAGTYGGGVFLGYSSPIITNCILWGDMPEEMYVYSGNPQVTYSDIQGGSGGAWFGTGCIDTVPLFVDAGDGNYQLGSASPCIDAGDNTAVPTEMTTDLAGAPRIRDGDDNGTATIDMGAYEAPLSNVPGDLDGDGDVDNDDFSIFADCMLGPAVAYPAGCEYADMDEEGDVDLADFANFQRAYTEP